MMIFSRMFNFMTSRMDELIDEEKDIRIILDEPMLLQELATPQQQYKLLNYLKDHPDYLDTLIGLIVEAKEEDSIIKNNNKYQQYQRRYPFLASEILSKENDFFQDFLFEEQNVHYLNNLFDIINQDYINITQASYFAKVILNLLRKKHTKMLAYLEKRDLNNLLKHIDINHIADIIEKIIIPDINDDINPKSKEVLQRVMKIAIHRYYEIDVFDNCLQIINNLIKQSILNWELIELPLNPYFFLTVCYQSQRTSAYELIANLLYCIQTTGKEDYYLNFIDVAKHLPSALSTQNIFSVPYKATYGKVVYPLQTNKLVLLQIYYLLLVSEKEEIISQLQNNKSFQILTNVILHHQFNNQALIWFDKIVEFISQKLPNVFLQNQDFLAETIIQYNKNEKTQIGLLKYHIKPGYQGILTKISNVLVDNHYTNDEWEKYVNETLNEINKIEKRLLCDVDPKNKQCLNFGDEFLTQQVYDNSKTTDNNNDTNYNTDNNDQHDIGYIGDQQNIDEDNNQDNEDNNEDNDENNQEDQENQENQDNEYPGDYEEEQEEKFYDCDEEGQQQFQEEHNKKRQHKYSEEEQEQIQEKIEEIIQDPNTNINQVALVLEGEEKLVDEHVIENVGPVELEKLQDHQVNEYFKKHDESEQ